MQERAIRVRRHRLLRTALPSLRLAAQVVLALALVVQVVVGVVVQVADRAIRAGLVQLEQPKRLLISAVLVVVAAVRQPQRMAAMAVGRAGMLLEGLAAQMPLLRLAGVVVRHLRMGMAETAVVADQMGLVLHRHRMGLVVVDRAERQEPPVLAAMVVPGMYSFSTFPR